MYSDRGAVVCLAAFLDALARDIWLIARLCSAGCKVGSTASIMDFKQDSIRYSGCVAEPHRFSISGLGLFGVMRNVHKD